ncbi:MAG: alpha/beta hydrolase, partial [Halobacteria archaeon]|nr:alpha/beta hydrolase [Halobacteria archaeon]
IPGFAPDDLAMDGGMDESNHAPEELVVFVHGWQTTPREALSDFSSVREAFRENGYDHPVVGFSWDSDTRLQDWNAAKRIAR